MSQTLDKGPAAEGEAVSPQAAPAVKPPPLWLKALVIGQGIAILVGLGLIGGVVVQRALAPASPGAPGAAVAEFTLPEGAEILKISADEGMVILHVKRREGSESLFLVDAESGRLTREMPIARGGE